MTFNQQPPNKIERLRQEHNTLNKLWNLYHEKWTKLGEDLAIENDTATKNKLEKQIKDARTELNNFEIQLSNIESMLPQPQITQSQNDEIQQELPNRGIPEIDQEIEQVKEELRQVRKRPKISNLWSYLKALIIKVYTCKKKPIIYLVLVLCGGVSAVLLFNNRIPYNPDVCQLPAADVSNIDFSPNGKYLATASLDKTVRILKVAETIDQKNGIIACKKDTEGVVAVKFSHDGKYLATASLDSASLWNVNNGSISFEQALDHESERDDNRKYKNAVVAIDFSQDNNYLATASANGEIKVWDIKTRKRRLLKPSQLYQAYIVSVKFSYDGNYITTTSINGKAQVCDLKANSSPCKSLPWPSKPTSDFTDSTFSLNDKYLATASADGTVYVWEPPFDKPVAPNGLKNNTYIMDVSFSPGGKYIAAISLDKKAYIWDWDTKTKVNLLDEDLNKNTNVTAIAFSSDDEYLAVANKDSDRNCIVTVLKITSKAKVDEFPFQKDDLVVAVAFSPTPNDEDEKYLAMASADGRIEFKKLMK